MIRRCVKLLQQVAVDNPLTIPDNNPLNLINTTGNLLVGQMTELDLKGLQRQYKNNEPSYPSHWNVKHQWGTNKMDISWEDKGFCVNITSALCLNKSDIRLNTRLKNREYALHSNPMTTSYGGRGSPDREIIINISLSDLSEQDEQHLPWEMIISATIIESVLVLSKMEIVHNPKTAVRLPIAYSGPALTEFHLAWSLSGGRGFGWNPMKAVSEKTNSISDQAALQKIEMSEGDEDNNEQYDDREWDSLDMIEKLEVSRQELRKLNHQLEILKSDEHGTYEGSIEVEKLTLSISHYEKEYQLSMDKIRLKDSLRRSLFKSADPGHLIKERQQFTFAPDKQIHNSFVTFSPEATDSLYNFLDTIAVNDINLIHVEELATYLSEYEILRKTHEMMDLLSAV